MPPSPEISERSAVSGIELPNPYEVILATEQGQQVELPWDFARHYCDQLLPADCRGNSETGRHALGGRIRHYRESAGFTQEALARAAVDYRASHPGQAGKRRADAQIQDIDRYIASPGKAGQMTCSPARKLQIIYWPSYTTTSRREGGPGEPEVVAVDSGRQRLPGQRPGDGLPQHLPQEQPARALSSVIAHSLTAVRRRSASRTPGRRRPAPSARSRRAARRAGPCAPAPPSRP